MMPSRSPCSSPRLRRPSTLAAHSVDCNSPPTVAIPPLLHHHSRPPLFLLKLNRNSQLYHQPPITQPPSLPPFTTVHAPSSHYPRHRKSTTTAISHTMVHHNNLTPATTHSIPKPLTITAHHRPSYQHMNGSMVICRLARGEFQKDTDMSFNCITHCSALNCNPFMGVCISDMVPFYLEKLFRQTKASEDICSKIGVAKDKVVSITRLVQKYGNLLLLVKDTGQEQCENIIFL